MAQPRILRAPTAVWLALVRPVLAQIGCPAPAYRLDQVAPTSSSPTCRPCAPLVPPSSMSCLIDASACKQVETGGSCEVRCRQPYRGNTTVATCMAGNSDANLQLLYTLPDCDCPEPLAQQGYVRSSSGRWECAAGYAGQPSINCEKGTVANNCSVRSWLEGCLPLAPCAASVVDTCRYDVSACSSVQPGQDCEVRCKAPFKGTSVRTSCPASNTDPARELANFSLMCSLDTCPDPVTWPTGYNKTADGRWQCANGFNGEAVKRCVPGASWQSNCGTIAALEGCKEVVPCSPEELVGMDACMYDVSGCQNVAPGASCEVHCKAPFQGVSTRGNSCPVGNTNRTGLVWTAPQCSLVTCSEPVRVPSGYQSTPSGWQCAQSYSGYAKKLCEATETCEVVPRLTGCAQLVPCGAPQADCRYNTYGCASVQPGGTCQLSCKSPFTGGRTTATCPMGNTDPNGLEIAAWPTCRVDTCADPSPWPLGYVRAIGGWRCASGFTGAAVKSCQWIEATCSAEPVLTGCTMEEPCAALQLSREDDRCKYNVSQCASVNAGSSCLVSCNAPYKGDPAPARCPTGNVDRAAQPQWSPPQCDCQDPSPLPPGYNKTDAGRWSCAEGFAGKAEKICRPRAGCQPPEALLTGCFVPVPCEVAGLQDAALAWNSVSGRLQFGPALIDTAIQEGEVEDYRVFFGDACNRPMGDAIAIVEKTPEVKTCCQPDAYEALITSKRPPQGAEGLLILVRTARGTSHAGRFLTLDIGATQVQRVVSAGACRLSFAAIYFLTFLS